MLIHEFKSALNRYLASLGPHAPVKTLREVIAFNNRHPDKMLRYGQKLLEQAEEETSGTLTEPKYIHDRLANWRKSREEGIDRLIREHELDALLCPGVTDSPAVSGYPAIIVPAGLPPGRRACRRHVHRSAYSEPALLRIAYAFEQICGGRTAPRLTG